MVEENKKIQLSEQELLMTETVIKVAAIERILLKSGLLTEEGMRAEIKIISEEIIKHISSIKQNASGN